MTHPTRGQRFSDRANGMACGNDGSNRRVNDISDVQSEWMTAGSADEGVITRLMNMRLVTRDYIYGCFSHRSMKARLTLSGRSIVR